ncbi:MAG: hypothetical protein WA820_28065 [Bradyrhizobium sp.]
MSAAIPNRKSLSHWSGDAYVAVWPCISRGTLGLKEEAAIGYANGFVASDLKNRPGGATLHRVANDLSKNGILEQLLRKG